MPVSIPAFDVPAFILPDMNDPDLLRRISNEAIAFDRAHFADGIDPAPKTMVEHHLRLATDRKLITRLQPRFAVALGFFEGYAKAVEERSERAPNVVTDELLLEAATAASNGYGIYAESMKLLGLTEKQKREVGLGEHTWGYVVLGYVAGALRKMKEPEPQNIGIVVKPKPPPPPPPPVAIVAPNELRTEIDDELARAAANYANGNATDTIEDDMRKVRYALTRPYYEHAGWYRSAVDFVEGALWELARIENAHVGDEPTMYFPPAFDRVSMPSDEEIARFCVLWINPHTSHVTAIRAAIAHFIEVANRPVNECSDSDRLRYEITIAQQRAQIEELKAKYLQKKGDYKTASDVISDLHVALRSFALPTNPKALAAELSRRQKEMEKLPDEAQPGSGITYLNEDNKVMFRGSSGQETVAGSPESAIDSPVPLVFRDEGERDFWDEQAHALNRRGDRLPSDVAHAADEMVEERRKRMPSLATNCAAISDELLLEAATYANAFCELKSDRTDLQNAKSAMNGNTVVELRWSNAVRSYANGAIRKARKP